MYRLSRKSTEILTLAHEDLQTLFLEGIKDSPIDFSIIFSHRSQEKQFELYQTGRQLVGETWVIKDREHVVTFKDGYKKKSKHNHSPALAVDFCAYIGKASWDPVHLAAIGGHLMGVANRLYREGKIKNKMRWGADWNNNGVLVNKDNLEGFVDLPHIEIII